MDLEQNLQLKQFVKQCAQRHNPFSSVKRNKNYQDKYLKLFNFFFSQLQNFDDRVYVRFRRLQKIGQRNCRKIIVDMHNDNLLFYPMRNFQITHGNLNYSKYGRSIGVLVGNYSLSTSLVEQLKEQEKSFSFQFEFKYHQRPLYTCPVNPIRAMGSYIDLQKIYLDNAKDIVKNNEQQLPVDCEEVKEKFNELKIAVKNNSKDLPKNLSEYRKIVKEKIVEEKLKSKIYTDNLNYLGLTLDGKNLLEELPHYGKYIDGRIYSKFHCLKRIKRSQLKLNGNPIYQFGDVSHAYPTFLGKLIEGKLPEDKVKEYQKYISHNDIYTDALKEAGIEPTKENRNSIKPYFNKYINSTSRDNYYNLNHSSFANDKSLLQIVDNFFTTKFKELSQFMDKYPTTKTREFNLRTLKWKTKEAKNIAHDLQRVEKTIITKITDKIKVPFVTLHDGIYIEEQNKDKIGFKFETQLNALLAF